MVNWWQGLALGIVQGLTEFLPVSSSGHLALAQQLLPGFSQPGVLFDVCLHLATALAVVIYFYQDLVGLLKRKAGGEVSVMSGGGALKQADWKLMGAIVIATIPTGALGWLLKDRVESTFQQPIFVGGFLVITALMLFGADLAARWRKEFLQGQDPGGWQSIVIGVAQGLAVFPGISRSGATISAGIFTGSRGDYAARFSFLCSVPAVLGAAMLSLWDERSAIAGFQAPELLAYGLGMLAALVAGYFSIGLMFKVVRRTRLSWFGIYCAVAGGTTILVMSLR